MLILGRVSFLYGMFFVGEFHVNMEDPLPTEACRGQLAAGTCRGAQCTEEIDLNFALT